MLVTKLILDGPPHYFHVSDHLITYLYFIRTVIHFSYVMFSQNLD